MGLLQPPASCQGASPPASSHLGACVAHTRQPVSAAAAWPHPVPPAQGPLPNSTLAFDKDISVKEHKQDHQSAAFVVVHKPGSPTRIAW